MYYINIYVVIVSPFAFGLFYRFIFKIIMIIIGLKICADKGQQTKFFFSSTASGTDHE